jgi:hypothetical protein
MRAVPNPTRFRAPVQWSLATLPQFPRPQGSGGVIVAMPQRTPPFAPGYRCLPDPDVTGPGYRGSAVTVISSISVSVPVLMVLLSSWS